MTAKNPSDFFQTQCEHPERAFEARGTTFIKGFEAKLYHLINVGDYVEFVSEPDNEYDKNAVKLMINDVFFGYMPAELTEEYANSVARGEKWHGVVHEFQCGYFDDDRGKWQRGWIHISPAFDGQNEDGIMFDDDSIVWGSTPTMDDMMIERLVNEGVINSQDEGMRAFGILRGMFGYPASDDIYEKTSAMRIYGALSYLNRRGCEPMRLIAILDDSQESNETSDDATHILPTYVTATVVDDVVEIIDSMPASRGIPYAWGYGKYTLAGDIISEVAKRLYKVKSRKFVY